MSFLARSVSSISCAALLAACASGGSGGEASEGAGGQSGASPSGGSAGAGATPGAGGSATGGAPSTGGSGGSAAGTSPLGGGGFGGGGPPATTLVYVHDDTTLYQFDPAVTPVALAMVGTFDCIGGSGQDSSMTDFAVDSAGNLYGISAKHAYVLEVQGATVHCKSTVTLSTSSGKTQPVFYALSIAPPGVITDGKEVLVAGNTAGELWAIDDQGNTSQHGNFGPVPKKDQNGATFANAGKAWELSGDIVFLANGGSPIGFATVRDCPSPPSSSNCDTSDTLLEIDVAAMKTATTGSVTKSVRGKIFKAPGCSDTSSAAYGSMYGIAAWNDKVFGFSNKGELVDIDNTTGAACLVQTFTGDNWKGAGVTTIAPVIPPPPVPQ